LQQEYVTRFRILGTQVRRLLRRRLPIVPRNSPLIAPHTFGDDPIPLATDIAFIARWLGQEFALASRHPDEYRDGVPNVVGTMYLTKNDKLYRKCRSYVHDPQGL